MEVEHPRDIPITNESVADAAVHARKRYWSHEGVVWCLDCTSAEMLKVFAAGSDGTQIAAAYALIAPPGLTREELGPPWTELGELTDRELHDWFTGTFLIRNTAHN